MGSGRAMRRSSVSQQQVDDLGQLAVGSGISIKLRADRRLARSRASVVRLAASVGWAVKTGRTASRAALSATTRRSMPDASMASATRANHPPCCLTDRRARPRCTCSTTLARWK